MKPASLALLFFISGVRHFLDAIWSSNLCSTRYLLFPIGIQHSLSGVSLGWVPRNGRSWGPKARGGRVWWRSRGGRIETSAQREVQINSIGELRVQGLDDFHLCLDLRGLQLK